MTAKPGELKARWSNRERDIQYEWGGGGADKTDAHWLNTWLSFHKSFDGKTMLDEIEERGYDLTTLKISVKRKK